MYCASTVTVNVLQLIHSYTLLLSHWQAAHSFAPLRHPSPLQLREKVRPRMASKNRPSVRTHSRPYAHDTSSPSWSRDRLDLDDGAPGQFRSLDTRPGRFGRGDETLVDLVHRRKIGHVEEIDWEERDVERKVRSGWSEWAQVGETRSEGSLAESAPSPALHRATVYPSSRETAQTWTPSTHCSP